MLQLGLQNVYTYLSLDIVIVIIVIYNVYTFIF